MKDGKVFKGAVVVEVTPVKRGLDKPSLSYFSTEKWRPGSFVKISVRGRNEKALIKQVKDARREKSLLRQAGFTLKKLPKSADLGARLSESFLRAVKKSADFFTALEGEVLTLLLPKIILEEPQNFFAEKKSSKKDKLPSETVVLQMESEERFGHYRSLVRQCFARKKSLLFIAPTHEEVLRAKAELERGIEDFVFAWTLKLGKKELKEVWRRSREETHPVLFITTPAGLSWERSDLEIVVLERENSRAYHSMQRPFLHFKTFVKYLAKESRRRLILGDSLLSLETLKKVKDGDYGELSPLRWRFSGAPTEVIEMRQGQGEKERFEIFSRELKSFISEALSAKRRVFLFGVRKGLYPSTLCGDCGQTLTCLECGSPIVLHQRPGSEELVYVCHICSKERSAKTLCDHCGSWKLVPLGIGTEVIAKEARLHFPQTRIFILDKEHAPTPARAKALLKSFEREGGILIGTELALGLLQEVDQSAVVSLDSLFSIPDYAIEERIFYLLSHLREITKVKCLFQTRNVGKEVIGWAGQGHTLNFYQNEIAERERVHHPPFSLFIKVGVELKESALNETRQLLAKEFEEWQPDFIKRPAIKRGEKTLVMIIRVERELWPIAPLREKLALLDRRFLIKVDPESIL